MRWPPARAGSARRPVFSAAQSRRFVAELGRRHRWPAALVALAVLGCGGTAGRSTPGPPLDPGSPIVLISIDTLRADRLPAYGYRGVKTPAIDALRADGVLFERAYAHAPLTGPSHASILSGLLPPAHGVRDNAGYRLSLPADRLLPGRLRAAGYATGGAVSSIVLGRRFGFGGGFDLYDDAIPLRRDTGLGGLQRIGTETLAPLGRWLDTVAGRPFFAFLHLYEPHRPYTAPEPYASRYPPYEAEIATADRVLGELLDRLRRLGAYQRATIVLLSDHGEGLGDHGERDHGVLLYREALAVPLIVKLPHSRHAGAAVAAPVQLIDVAPTLLALAGLTSADALPGRSLLATLEGDAGVDDARPIFAETFYPRLHFGWSPLLSVIRGRYHYLEGVDGELYDLEADPAERHDLRDVERRTVHQLAALLDGYDRSLPAPSPVDEETRRAMVSLGYAGTAPADDGGPLPDPKTRVHLLADLDAAIDAFGAGDDGRAVAMLEAIVADSPRLVDAWECLGRARRRLGDAEGALAAHLKTVELSAGRVMVLPTAELLLSLGRRDDALGLLRAEQRRAPDPLRLHLFESTVLLQARDFAGAFAAAARAAALAPDDADAVYQRGSVRIGLGELEAAEADLRRALMLAPDHTAAMSDLAMVLDHRGARAEATALLRRVLALRPDDRVAAGNLARIESAAGG